MSIHTSDEDSDEGEFFVDEDDIIYEELNNEVLPDEDDDMESDDSTVLSDEDDDDMESDGSTEKEEEVGAVNSIYTFQGHTDEVYTVACHPKDPSLVATGGKDDKAFLWKIGDPNAIIELPGHKDTVSAVAFSHDGQLLASASYDGSVHVWDIASVIRKVPRKVILEGYGKGFEWVKWHPKEHTIIAGPEIPKKKKKNAESEDCNIYMWKLTDRGDTFPSLLCGHSRVVTCADFTPDGKILCSGSKDGTMRLWNPTTRESIHRVTGHNYHQVKLKCMAIIDSTLAITGARDGSVHMVNLSSGQVNGSLIGHTGLVECIGVSPSFGFVATGGRDGKLIIWELRHCSVRCICKHKEVVTCVAWLGTTKYVASGCTDGKVRIWDSLSGNCERTFLAGRGKYRTVESLALTGDGSCIVSVSYDGTSHVFDIQDFK